MPGLMPRHDPEMAESDVNNVVGCLLVMGLSLAFNMLAGLKQADAG